MKILLVHGRSQAGKDPQSLKDAWLEALAHGCRAAQVAMPASPDLIAFPFYGDRLAALEAGFGTRLVEQGPGDDDPYFGFRQEVAEEVRLAAGISDAEVLAELPPDERTLGPQNWAWVHAILRAIDHRFPAVSDGILGVVTRDVWLYMTAPGVRDEVDEIIGAMLDVEPTVVVGHSLGSVVTYSVLRRRQGLMIPRYVTLGSPLGLKAIRRRFAPLRFPSGVGDWFNAYDPRDVVALRPLDGVTWPVTPEIRNKGNVDNATDNRHGIAGYLSDPDVARAIVTAE
jgi:hypothetical protein